jgi:hypothetical protein
MDSSSLNATDQLGGRDATHPRVALADINAAIMDEYICSGAQVVCADASRCKSPATIRCTC